MPFSGHSSLISRTLVAEHITIPLNRNCRPIEHYHQSDQLDPWLCTTFAARCDNGPTFTKMVVNRRSKTKRPQPKSIPTGHRLSHPSTQVKSTNEGNRTQKPAAPRITGQSTIGSSPRSGGIGCWFILRTGLVMIMLLLVNGLLVRAFLSANSELANELRIAQALQFALPVGLIFLEYWVFDFFRNLSRG